MVAIKLAHVEHNVRPKNYGLVNVVCTGENNQVIALKRCNISRKNAGSTQFACA